MFVCVCPINGLPLCDDDAGAEERPGLLHAHEGEQVHALVLRLLEQRVDPSGDITSVSHKFSGAKGAHPEGEGGGEATWIRCYPE